MVQMHLLASWVTATNDCRIGNIACGDFGEITKDCPTKRRTIASYYSKVNPQLRPRRYTVSPWQLLKMLTNVIHCICVISNADWGKV